MKTNLIQGFIQAGLLQFGRFYDTEAAHLFRWQLDMLPSYPLLLQQISEAALEDLADANMDYLLSDRRSVPLGTAISLKRQTPLVYSQGNGLAPAHDFVGAYDVGHPTCLLLNEVGETAQISALFEKAGSVGLNIHRIWTIVNLTGNATVQGMQIEALFQFDEIIQHLLNEKVIPSHLANAIERP